MLTFIGQLSLDYIFGDVKELPGAGEEVMSSNFNIQLGGGTLVYPIILTKLGIDCHLIVKKSNSIQADLAYQILNKYQIKKVETIEVDDYDPVMSTAVISLKDDRSFISYNDSRAFQFDDDFLFERFENSKIVFALEQNKKIISKLKENGSIIIFDVGWSNELDIKNYEAVFKYVDYFTPNDKEAMKMTHTGSVEESLYILKKYVKHPIVSCGRDGCMTIINNEIQHVGIPNNIKAVDTTGAGDNFMAGLIYGIYKEMTIEESMKFANCTGALSTTGYGCYGADYSLEDVWTAYHQMK